LATHFHRLRVKDIRRETTECVSIAFEIPETIKEHFRFHQGQNITIRLMVGDEEVRRSYSICSSPLENELRVAVKEVPEGKFSSHANKTLKVDDVLEVLSPTGSFFTPLSPDQSKNYLAFAAGSGITPILSIIKTVLATEPQSNFTLIYGNRNRASIIFKEELEALKNKYMRRFALHNILSREQTDAPINHGRINAAKCDEFNNRLFDISTVDEVFLCGPEEMIFGVREWLEKKGIERKNIHFELFGVPGQLKSASTPDEKHSHTGQVSKVSVKIDGITFDFDLDYDGSSILDAALKQGADLPFACKGGVCATCKAKLVEGEVEMDTNYALEPEETAAGFVLTCQSHPRSPRVIVDLDIK
jgi:ring-1,2-phenylacetyl-CoA epoxidase subunit PaaE